MNFLLPQFTIKSWVTYESKFNIFWVEFKKHIWQTSRGRPQKVPLFGPWDVPQMGPVDVQWTSPYRTFECVFPVKKSNKCVKQKLLHLENTLFYEIIKFFVGPL